jgi:hypothetical protein
VCAQDIREELISSVDNIDLRFQLGAVLGMLGDCWYGSLSLDYGTPSLFFPLCQTEHTTGVPVRTLGIINALLVQHSKSLPITTIFFVYPSLYKRVIMFWIWNTERRRV